MAVPPRDAARLRHIEAASERVALYTAGGHESLTDARTLDAVLHCLAVIGEAVGTLSEGTYAKLTSLPPGAPISMRNLIVHEYWRVDPVVVWTTVARDIPSLLRDVRAVLERDA